MRYTKNIVKTKKTETNPSIFLPAGSLPKTEGYVYLSHRRVFNLMGGVV